MKRKLKRLQQPRNGIQYIISPQTRKELSPFVFFDAGTMQRNDDGLHIGSHPHSGIAIITYFEGGELRHDDTGDNTGLIRDGGVQWIQAGGGIWHEEHYQKKQSELSESWSLTIHQLWMQLPADLEESDVAYQNIQPEDLPVSDNIKVVVGDYHGMKSPLTVPFDMTYLDVRLKTGESFALSTPAGQTTGFIFPREGNLVLHGDEVPLGNLSILENNEGELLIEAKRDSKFVVIMAEPQGLPMIVLGGSIHTTQGGLEKKLGSHQSICSFLTENFLIYYSTTIVLLCVFCRVLTALTLCFRMLLMTKSFQRTFLCLCGLFLLSASWIWAQPGPIKNLRYDDDFRYLLLDSVEKKGTEKLKYIPLSNTGEGNLTLGGELREWYEIRRNPNFGDLPPEITDNPSGSLLHRMMLHADLRISKRLRLFGQLNNTWEFGNPNPPIPEINEDGLGLHQLFVELDLTTGKMDNQNLVRLGRQEYNFGNELVISSREGPNNRQAFDGATFINRGKNHQVHVLGATPVIINPGFFDNTHIPEAIWGAYAYLRQQKNTRLDLYYLGFYSERRQYNYVPGDQNRHTIGTRLWNHSYKVFYDLETMYQTGKFNDLTINAFNFTGEARYVFRDILWKPMIGIGLRYITGDYDPNDGQMNTYDPMYPKPVYGLATPQGPSNISHVKPTLGIQPLENLFLNFSWYLLARTSNRDGTYSPSMDQVRPIPGATSDKFIVGNQFSLDIFWIKNQNLSFITFVSYVEPGNYVIETGVGKSVFFWASAVQYKF